MVQVQAVLLLLGGRDIPTGVPTIEVPYDKNNRVIICRYSVIKSYLDLLCPCLCGICTIL